MQLIMDGLLVAAALFAGTYCWVLSRRVLALKDLDSGLGGAITQMTRALEDARRALEEAKAGNREGRQELRELITRAEAASGQLRILLAASRDLAPEPAPRPAPAERATEAASAGPAELAPEALPAPRPVRAVEPEAARRTPTLGFVAAAGVGEPEVPEGEETVDLAPRPAPPPIPKPRRVFPVETLRPRPPTPPVEAPQDESGLLAELAALAVRRS